MRSPDIIETISMKMAYLPVALQQLGRFVIDRPEDAKNMTISDLASEVGVADSTVTRFVKSVGLNRFQDLKIALAEVGATTNKAQEAAAAYVYHGISSSDSTQMVLDKVTHQAMESLALARRSLDISVVDRVVDLLSAGDVIWFYGQGSSSLSAHEGQLRFTRAGKRSVFHNDQSLQQMSAAILGPSDVVVAISNSGRSQLVVEAVERAASAGAGTVAITAFPDSPLARLADHVVFTEVVPRGNVGEHGEEVASKWAQMLVIDTIYARFAALNAEATARALERTHRAGIRSTRLP